MADVIDHGIPKQKEGAQSNTLATWECNSSALAQQLYGVARTRLLAVNNWQAIAGGGTAAEFQLHDTSGTPVQRAVVLGDYFRIAIPGPGNAAGGGYDWVRVEALEEDKEADQERIHIRVRPAAAPINDSAATAHFFSATATSSFVVRRNGQTVMAEVHGRNEKPNTHTGNLGDTIRNAAVATGAVSGLAKIQWKALVEGLLRN